MAPMEYLEALGTLIHEKNLKSKISCQTPFKVYQYSLYMRIWLIYFSAALIKIKKNKKFLLASMKTLTNSKNCLESCIRISVLAFLISHWSISPVYYMLQAAVGQFSESLAAFGSIFRVLFLLFFPKKQPTNLESISDHYRKQSKGTDQILETFKSIYSSRDTISLMS